MKATFSSLGQLVYCVQKSEQQRLGGAMLKEREEEGWEEGRRIIGKEE